MYLYILQIETENRNIVKYPDTQYRPNQLILVPDLPGVVGWCDGAG